MGSDVPKDLKNILVFCGFDNELSLMTLNEEKVQELEDFVEKNRESAAIKKIRLVQNTEFKLNPGQKAVILSLPVKCRSFVEQRKTEPTKKFHKKTIKRSTKTELEIKNELIEKLKNYMRRWKFSVNITSADITEYKINNGVNTCRIKCPFCEKRYLVNYTTHWVVSNTEAHIRNHITEILANRQSNATKNLAQNSSMLSSSAPVQHNCASNSSLHTSTLASSGTVTSNTISSEAIEVRVNRVEEAAISELNSILKSK